MAKDGTSRGGARVGAGRRPNALADKIAQIKNKVGLEKRRNYNTGERKNRIANCPHERQDAIMDAFRYFNLI